MELQLKLLQETTDEMARNGCKKIIIVNGHGGNEHLLPFFAQAQLDKPHDYVVYVLDGERSRPGGPAKKSTGIDYHAGENETSNTLVSHPELVHLDRAASESGADHKRLILPETIYTGIWWYARFPDHYSGDGSVATKELGKWNMDNWIALTFEAIRAEQAPAGHAALRIRTAGDWKSSAGSAELFHPAGQHLIVWRIHIDEFHAHPNARLHDSNDAQRFHFLVLARHRHTDARIQLHRLTRANEYAAHGNIGSHAGGPGAGFQVEQLNIRRKRVANLVAAVADGELPRAAF